MPCNRSEGEDVCVHEEQEKIRRLMKPRSVPNITPVKPRRAPARTPVKVPVKR